MFETLFARYAEIDLQTKARALATYVPAADHKTRKHWRQPQAALMEFLRAL
jgi:integrase/recombinase XerD